MGFWALQCPPWDLLCAPLLFNLDVSQLDDPPTRSSLLCRQPHLLGLASNILTEVTEGRKKTDIALRALKANPGVPEPLPLTAKAEQEGEGRSGAGSTDPAGVPPLPAGGKPPPNPCPRVLGLSPSC